jgi:outer membrane protein OmpA-like peptidoglycan-associated protein
MKEYSKANFSVQGHTDSQGRAANNMKLSERRAKAVADYLSAKAGIASSRLTSAGFGEDYPIADNKTRAGRAQNRRVEIKLAK